MTKNLNFTIGLAKKAGNLLISRLDKIRKIQYKKGDLRHPTFELEKKLENEIVAAIMSRFPGHNVMREEGEDINNKSEYTWIIDPIDGTRYFINGIKFFTVSIGLWQGNEPLIGVVYNPGAGDCYFAETGKGSFLNDKKLAVSKIDNLPKSIIALDTTGTDRLNGAESNLFFRRLKKVAENFYRFRAFGSGSLSLCYLAQGHLEAYFDLSGREEVLDIGAGLAIAKEAGAKITDPQGNYPGLDTNYLVVTNGLIHNKLLKLLNEK